MLTNNKLINQGGCFLATPLITENRPENPVALAPG